MESKFFTDRKGDKIRFFSLRNPKSKGAVVIAQGYRQHFEQYDDIAQEFYNQGYSVYGLDWKGQGGSERYLNDKLRIHSEGFEDHDDTFDYFLNNVVVKDGKPLILTAHSMGANIASRYMKTHPNTFDKGVVIAQMVAFDKEDMPELSLKFAEAVGTLDRPVNKAKQDKFEQKGGMGRNRNAVRKIFKAFKENPELKTSGPTMGFLKSVKESMDMVRGLDVDGKPYVSSIKTPMLCIIPEDDEMSLPKYQEEMADNFGNAQRVYVTGGHNALFDKDSNVVKTVLAFIQQDNANTPKVAHSSATIH